MSGALAVDRVDDLRAHLARNVFRPSVGPDQVGAEVEIIPVDPESGRIFPVAPAPGDLRSSRRFLRRWSERRGWSARRSAVGAPGFRSPDGGRLSFEPGGQIEYSSPPMRSVDGLARRLRSVVDGLVREGREEGLEFVARGVNPVGAPSEAPLQVRATRYRRMSDHYDRIGPWGRCMMRQSAAIHVNVDLGADPFARYRVASRAAPSLIAIFANSPRAEGSDTGHRSWRAAQWRRLDPSRTGIPGVAPDPLSGYEAFARGADAFLLGPDGEPAKPFGIWLDEGVATGALRTHLSTLFPEVRPRGYLEIRAFDALPPMWYGVPIVVTAGLLCDADSLQTADRLLADVVEEDLEPAGRGGVRDASIRNTALQLFDLALEGAARLRGLDIGEALEVAADFRARFTVLGRDPGDGPGIPRV